MLMSANRRAVCVALKRDSVTSEVDGAQVVPQIPIGDPRRSQLGRFKLAGHAIDIETEGLGCRALDW
jgi:hypothetical protein